jgi:hypothetical protein
MISEQLDRAFATSGRGQRGQGDRARRGRARAGAEGHYAFECEAYLGLCKRSLGCLRSSRQCHHVASRRRGPLTGVSPTWRARYRPAIIREIPPRVVKIYRFPIRVADGDVSFFREPPRVVHCRI